MYLLDDNNQIIEAECGLDHFECSPCVVVESSGHYVSDVAGTGKGLALVSASLNIHTVGIEKKCEDCRHQG